tara:strand:- start:86 stop:544 length:459 start_codon:yes stop_codon:yes gene_type:complete
MQSFKVLKDKEYEEMISNYSNLSESDKRLLRDNHQKRKRENETSEDIAVRVEKALFNFFSEMIKPDFPLGYDEIAEMHTLALRFEERDLDWLSMYAKEIIEKCRNIFHNRDKESHYSSWGLGRWTETSMRLNSIMLYIRKAMTENRKEPVYV